MAKLYFRYGAMCSSKTMNLLAVAHNYRMQNKQAVLIKPEKDNRWDKQSITSRAGFSYPADIILNVREDPIQELFNKIESINKLHCILVDEAQFLTPYHIDRLRLVTQMFSVPVICYGIRTDFRTNCFPGSKRLMEIADTIEEVKTTCQFCNRKATFNLKHGGDTTDAADAVETGAEDLYLPACFGCYRQYHLNANTCPGCWKNTSVDTELISKSV